MGGMGYGLSQGYAAAMGGGMGGKPQGAYGQQGGMVDQGGMYGQLDAQGQQQGWASWAGQMGMASPAGGYALSMVFYAPNTPYRVWKDRMG